jgi:hypothetical protein
MKDWLNVLNNRVKNKLHDENSHKVKKIKFLKKLIKPYY